MIGKKLIFIDKIPDNLLSDIENRDIALWVQSLPKDPLCQDAVVNFMGLPWRLVLSEIYEPGLFQALDAASSFSNPMTRKRGFVQIIDSDPSRIELPQRCLPIYLLNGKQVTSLQGFDNVLRRMTMLESLRRSGIRQILVISGDSDPVPQEIKELWSSGFRSNLTLVSDVDNADEILGRWLENEDGIVVANLLRLAASKVINDILSRYMETYPEDRHVIRVRDHRGNFHKIDVTELDDPERPILEQYSLIEERSLTLLGPADISEEDFVAFFRNPESSWRPYAAGLPWIRDVKSKTKLIRCLEKLDVVGSDENFVAYIASEQGAGGTTFARKLAWECAREGYPVLIAKPMPFVADALPVVNFLYRIYSEIEGKESQALEQTVRSRVEPQDDRARSTPRHYEVPWVIVFDGLHWQNRDRELIRFLNELKTSGRPACILIVTGTILGLPFYSSGFKKVAELNHALEQDEALQLGRHLNSFLRFYGKERKEWQWKQFYETHTVCYLEGTAAFWVTLSFWIQGQYDLSESIQEWMYRTFKENTEDQIVQDAILDIAAMSSERLPLPEALLSTSKGKWPVSHLLEDSRARLATLGLVRISKEGEKYWALVHDILGRFLINALFYDFPMREKLGFSDAKDADHLRFLLLRRISQKSVLGELAYRSIGENFATLIFKIDPDHGHGSFSSLWREVLDALDEMPRPLRDTSRVFRHHIAISRRRIAKLSEQFYGVKIKDKIALLSQAIEDINYALKFIEYRPGSEPNINLFTSLANAYLDLAEVESEEGAPLERLVSLRKLANDATRKVYEENPTDSFAIEAYVKNLLTYLPDSAELVVEQCIEALGILFSAISSNDVAFRKPQLGILADRTLKILFKQTPLINHDSEPKCPIDVLIKAWAVLAENTDSSDGMVLSDLQEANRRHAVKILAHPVGRGNMQIIRLSYDLICIDSPFAFKQQLELVEQLQATDYRMTPQLRLEYAILLFQNNRATEGDRIFQSLRKLWKESEHFVKVPERLHWFLTVDSKEIQTVHAITGSDDGNRPKARVQEFSNALAPFRPEEFGIRDPSPGSRFSCHVSFGHNGPFLRPVTAHPAKADRG